MAGLGLMNAVQGYMRGKQFADQQQELAYQQQKRAEAEAEAQQRKAKIDEANKAFAGTIEESKAKWALNGAQGEYRPNEETLFKAAEARGAALAKAGLWDEFIANEAKVAPMRGATRQRAVQRFEMDGDGEALARAIYPTLFDGKQLVAVKRNDGGGTGPQALDLEMSDGSRMTLGVDQLYKMAKVGTDPEALKREALLNFEREKAKILAGAKKEVDDHETANLIKLDEVKTKSKRGLQDADNEAAYRRTDRSARATEAAAAAKMDAAEVRGTAGGGRGGSNPRDEDGRTAAERDRLFKNKVDAASARIARINGSLQATTDPKERKRLLDQRAAAEKLHDNLLSEWTSPGGKPAAGAEDAAGLGMAMATAEAASSGKPVQFDLGGRRGTINPQGGLSDAAPASAAPPANLLKEGVNTKFKNGQVWTLKNGKAVKVSG